LKTTIPKHQHYAVKLAWGDLHVGDRQELYRAVGLSSIKGVDGAGLNEVSTLPIRTRKLNPTARYIRKKFTFAFDYFKRQKPYAGPA
jgi:hypothetical protein